jgi:hypothetical protein
VGNNPVNGIDPVGFENPIMGLGGSYNNDRFGPGGSFFGPGYLYQPQLGPGQSEQDRLYGNGMNNTLSGIGQSAGQLLYDASHLTWSSCEYNRIGSQMR